MANQFLVALGSGAVELFQVNDHVSFLNNDAPKCVYSE